MSAANLSPMSVEGIAQAVETVLSDLGLRVQVQQQSSVLHVMLHRPSDSSLDYTTVEQTVRETLASLHLPDIHLLCLYSRGPNSQATDWNRQIDLQTSISEAELSSDSSENETVSASAPSVESEFDLSKYCFVRSDRMLNTELPVPPDEIANSVRWLHHLSRERQQQALPLLERFFRNPEAKLPDDLADDQKAWLGSLKQLNEQKQRTAAIWLSRYCRNPEPTLAILGNAAPKTPAVSAPPAPTASSLPGAIAADPAGSSPTNGNSSASGNRKTLWSSSMSTPSQTVSTQTASDTPSYVPSYQTPTPQYDAAASAPARNGSIWKFAGFGIGSLLFGGKFLVPLIKLVLVGNAAVHGSGDFEALGATMPLHRAAAIGDITAVRSYIQQGENANVLDEWGRTPLHWAASGCVFDYQNWEDNCQQLPSNAETIKVLVSLGATVDVADANGSTPLHLASDLGFVETAEALLQNGAAVNAKDIDGETPLTWATYYQAEGLTEYGEMVGLLKRYGGSE